MSKPHLSLYTLQKISGKLEPKSYVLKKTTK